MAYGCTNALKSALLNEFLRGSGAPTTFYVALVTDATAPTPDTATLGELTEIAAGNGYVSGGMTVARDSDDWDTLTEDTNNDQVLIYIKNLVWTAAGGPIPASGDGARYAVLTDANVTVASRVVYAWWDLTTDRIAEVGNTLTLQDCGIALGEPTA